MGQIKSMAQATARPSSRWDGTHGSYLAGRAHLDGVDELAARLEWYWGCDRLRLLVNAELREKFDRQRYRINAAIARGSLEEVRSEAERMMLAWNTLDQAAHAAGWKPRVVEVWEITLVDGVVAAIVPHPDDVKKVKADGRQVVVYTLDEIAKLLELDRGVIEAKLMYPGATVTYTRRSVEDPLANLEPLGFDVSLNDDIPEMT